MKVICVSLSSGSRDWFLLADDGRYGIGPWGDGPTPFGGWHTPDMAQGDRIIDSADLDTVRAEIAAHGSRHLRSFLVRADLAEQTASSRFNRCDDLTGCIDFQFDYPGLLAAGIRTSYSCPSLGLEWTSEATR